MGRKYLLPIFVIPAGGLVLFGLTFMADFAFQSLLRIVFKAGGPLHVLFALLTLVASYYVLKADKLPDLLKAVYFTVPAIVSLITVYISLYQWPVMAYVSMAVVAALLILYLYRTRRSWIFYYALGFVGVVLLVVQLTGMEI